MSAFDTVLYEKHGVVAYVTLNRPRVMNVYNIQMRDDLYQVLQSVRDDHEVRGVIITGAGDRAFCAGADLTEFGTAPSQAVARHVRWERDVWGLFCSIDKPLVAALFGYVFGSGLEIAAMCDFTIASIDTVFSMPETALGMVPAAGGTQTFPRLVGPSRALDLFLTGRRFDAREALELGLVTKVVARDCLMDEARYVVEKVVSCDNEAIRLSKRAVNDGMEMHLRDALAMELAFAQMLIRRSENAMDG